MFKKKQEPISVPVEEPSAEEKVYNFSVGNI